MLWFLLVLFFLHYCMVFKLTWRKNAFSCREFKMKNKNRAIVIGSEASRDRKSDAEDISVLLSTRGPGGNSWSQRQVVCTGLCPHCIWLLPLQWIYLFFQFLVFEIVWGLHTSPSVALVKHETECPWNLMACGEFVGWGSSWLCGMADQVKGSRTGAGVSMLPFRRAPLTGVDMKLCLVLPWGWQQSRAGERFQQCGVSRCQYLVCSLALFCLAEHLYQGGLWKPENEITSLFLSFLGFRPASFRDCHV